MDTNYSCSGKGSLPPLTRSILDVICKARSGAHGKGLEAVLVTTPARKIVVTKEDIKTLAPNNGLNNIIMDAYLEMIYRRGKFGNIENKWPSVFVFRSCFYKRYHDLGHSRVQKHTRRVNIFDFDLLLFPIHLRDHWGLAAVDFRIKTIKYYDSMGAEYPECFKVLKQYLREEYKEVNQSSIRFRNWKTEIVEDIPHQKDEYDCDCGVFACKYAEYLSRDAELTFKQRDMHYYRKRMVYEIVKQDLMYP